MNIFDTVKLDVAGFQLTSREFMRYSDDEFAHAYMGWGFDAPAIKLQEVSLALSAMKLPASARILDLACGNGVSSIHLADKGFRVTALDLSPVFINAGRKSDAEHACSRQAGSLQWVVADASTYEDEPFDAVILLDPGFMTATRPFVDRLSTLTNRGGKFFLRYKDGTHGTMHLPINRWKTERDGCSILLEQHHFCQLTGSVRDEWITIDLMNKTILSETMERHIVLFRDFRALMEDAGFSLLDTWGDVHGGPVTDNSRLYALFVKA